MVKKQTKTQLDNHSSRCSTNISMKFFQKINLLRYITYNNKALTNHSTFYWWCPRKNKTRASAILSMIHRNYIYTVFFINNILSLKKYCTQILNDFSIPFDYKIK